MIDMLKNIIDFDTYVHSTGYSYYDIDTMLKYKEKILSLNERLQNKMKEIIPSIKNYGEDYKAEVSKFDSFLIGCY